MNEKNLKENFSELASLLVEINEKQDMYNFMRDLCTFAELEEFILRREIAKALHVGESYVSIQKRLWASSTTVARVAKYLQGDGWWYKSMLDNIWHIQ